MAERVKLLSFSDNADMCLGGICMFLVDFLFFSHRKSIDTSSIKNIFFSDQPFSPGTDIKLSFLD